MTGSPSWSRRLLWMGLAASCPAAILAVAVPAAFFPAYLAMACAWSALPVGALALRLAGVLIPGPWVGPADPPLRAAAATLPVAALLFLPVLAGLPWIFPWATGPVQAEVPWFRALWLTPAFFAVRTGVFFGVLWLVERGLRRADCEAARTRISCGGLMAWVVLGTFVGVDWMLSVEPRFHSSIFGLIVLSQQILSGVCVAILGGLAALGNPPRRGGLGGILIAALLFWAYLHAMQFIIVWTGNLPVEVGWYLRRGAGLWGFVALLLGVGGFLGVFNLLLLGPVRNGTAPLVALAGATLLLRPLETAWLILPATGAAGPWAFASALAALVAIGCLWGAACLKLDPGRSGQGRCAITTG